MKPNFITVIVLICIQFISFSQSDEELVSQVLMDYIEGTANGEITRLKSAFHPDANLYYVNNDTIKARSSKKYFTYFKEGKKSNRLGDIVSIDVKNNAAMGIVQIDMSNAKRRYTDYMLLLKENGKWKIVHKSYTYMPYERKGKILFVLSNMSTYGKTKKRTGTHFEELIKPYHALSKAGYEIDFISPKGGQIPVSYINLNDSLQLEYFYNLKLMQKLKNTYKPTEVDSDQYKAIYFCGGSAAMFDLPNNTDIQKLTTMIYENNNGIVSAICHGAAGIVNTKLSDGEYLVKNRTVTSFTNNEEGNKSILPFLLETKLKERNAKFKTSENWSSNVIIDGHLITGQNPNSLEEFNKALIEKLNEK